MDLLQLGLSNAVLATLLAILVAILAAVCRRPALTHALWLLVLLKLVTPPLLPVALPWPSPLAEMPTDRKTTAREPPLLPRLEPLPFRQADEERQLPRPIVEEPRAAALLAERAVPEETAPWRSALLAFWLTGSCLWWTVAAVRVGRFRRLLRLAQLAPADVQEQARQLAVRLGLRHCPAVWFVPACVSPLMWALGWSPRLLLPAELWERLTPEQRATLLAHELAHLRRRDPWVRRLELLALGLYWWHPVAWWARRVLAEAEEQCCDAWVVWALPEAAPAYAAALVETVAFLSRARRPVPLAASGAGHVGAIKRRLTMILRGPCSRALSGAGLVAVLGLAAILLPLLPTWAQEAPHEQPAAAALPAAKAAALPATQTVPGPEKSAKQKPPSGQSKTIQPPANLDPALAEQVQQARDDIELLEAQLEIKRAQVRAARTALESALQQRKQLANLAASGTLPRETLDRAVREAAALEAQLLIKEAEVREPEVRLRQARRRLAALELRGRTVVDPSVNEAWADALFDHRLIDFGNVQSGAKLAWHFRLTNKTATTLRFRVYPTSAAVPLAGKIATELKPGQQEDITGTLLTGRFAGPKTFIVTVEFSQPRIAEVKLAIRANSQPAGEKQPDPLPQAKGPPDRDRLLELEKKLGDLLKEVESLRKRLSVPTKPAPDEIEINERAFTIPIQIGKERKDIREIRVFVSPDGGGTWEQVATLPPTAQDFRFVAPADGIYWFRITVVNATGTPFPAENTNAAPALKVFVRTNR